MFGYVVINKPELKIKDFDKYQEYYCGLCQSLKQNHGRRGQLTLNYDLNFVGILLSSLYEPEEKQYWIRCSIHPFHKKRVRTNQYMDYVSDMNIILINTNTCHDMTKMSRDFIEIQTMLLF